MSNILISPGWGAGWSTWNDEVIGEYILTYQPIIEFLERGGKFEKSDLPRSPSYKPRHPLLQQLVSDCKEKFGDDVYVCLLGADDLEVVNVSGSYMINEYDGFESIEYRDEQDWRVG